MSDTQSIARLPQWIRTANGDLVNIAQAYAIRVVTEDSFKHTVLYADFGETEEGIISYPLASFTGVDYGAEDAAAALDILERLLPFAVISMELDVVSVVQRGAHK
jgi:hypothetical protein